MNSKAVAATLIDLAKTSLRAGHDPRQVTDLLAVAVAAELAERDQ